MGEKEQMESTLECMYLMLRDKIESGIILHTALHFCLIGTRLEKVVATQSRLRDNEEAFSFACTEQSIG